MAEPENATQPTEPEATTADDQTLSGAEQAPWAREGVEFDADKAWKLVLNLREENKGLREKNRAYEDEKLSEKERTDRDLAEACAELDRARTETALARIRAAYPALTEDDLQFLGSGSPEELEQRAAKLAARIAPPKPAAVPTHINPLNRVPTGGSDPTTPVGQEDPIRAAFFK